MLQKRSFELESVLKGSQFRATQDGGYPMNPQSEVRAARSLWFVGARYDDSEDQTLRFVGEGIWENGGHKHNCAGEQPGSASGLRNTDYAEPNAEDAVPVPRINRGYGSLR